MVVRGVVGVLVLLGLSACAPTLRHPTAFGTDCEAFDADVTCVRVFYGSNRAIVATAQGDAEVDVDQVARGDAGELRLGRADVWLPRLKAQGRYLPPDLNAHIPQSWLFWHRWADGGRCPRSKQPLVREEVGGRTTCWSAARQKL